MQDYRKLRVWQGAHQLAIEVYALPPYLLKPECWPLRDQVLRSPISIPSNIAEGAGRGTNPDFSRFCWNSMGSCNELESQLLLASDSKFIPRDVHVRVGDANCQRATAAHTLHPDPELSTPATGHP